MHIGIVSATTKEIEPTLHYLMDQWNSISLMNFQKGDKLVFPLVTGIGSTAMAFALARFQSMQKLDFMIHLGIAGSYQSHYEIGELREVISERWGDLGAEEADGSFLDSFELNLIQPDRFPFQESVIRNEQSVFASNLPVSSGLTVNAASGWNHSIELRKNKYNADLESMEGVGLFYACRMLDLPFLSIRAISNLVEPRNKNNWNTDLAIRNLNNYAIEFLKKWA
ncbi:MAG: futalosine hydrolase [Saprospiraceae bacterium]|nr:futalosine hydrolase [Saprospiraceae bacterium]